jgi:lipid-A-disaccharide synthase
MKNSLNPTKKEKDFLKEKMDKYDIFIFAAEDSADVFGQNLIKELLSLDPQLKILAVAGPRMRKYNIKTLMKMENFHIMGFIDIIFALPKLIKNFIYLRKTILKYNPKICIFIDYPDFNLLLEKSLKKRGYKNKLVHYVAPTVWAWRKKRANFMAKYVDLVLSIFPFEKKYFSHTNLDIRYIGHPIAYDIINMKDKNFEKNLIGIFPGSRKKEIEKNFPIQLQAAKKLLTDNNNLKFAISVTHKDLINKIFKKSNPNLSNFIFFHRNKNYVFMKKLKMAIATSGTITLELALNKVPTVVNYAIKPLDLFIAKNLIKINLPYYCMVNIIANKEIFFELYGPNLTINNLYEACKKFLFNENKKNQCLQECENLIQILGNKNANKKAAKIIYSFL